MALPPGYNVRENSAVGYDFTDEAGRVVVQHPKDNKEIRALVWEIYRRKQTAQEPGRCANPEFHTFLLMAAAVVAVLVCLTCYIGWRVFW